MVTSACIPYISDMAKAALENAILYMIRSYKESGLLTQREIEEVLDSVRRRIVRQM
jgi:hypothetical protein